MKIAKKVLKTIGVLLGFIVVIVLGYIIYLYASYHRIEDNKSLSVESHTETKQTLTTGKQYSAITYNIGFGAYTPDFSFFMDGGKSSWAKSKKSVLKTVKNAGNLTKSYDPDFALIEEVDLNSTRSYHVNEYSILKKCLKNYDTVFAQNYDSAFLFYPFTQPHGSSKAGLALFSRYLIKDSLRRSLPISTSYNKFFDLDRCYSVSRIPVDNGKYLVIFQLHMSAYGNSDKIRKGQIRMLPEHFSFCMDQLPKKENLWNSSRNADMKYIPGKTYTVTLDGFIISDNVKCDMYKNINTGYSYSDHDPVYVKFELNKESVLNKFKLKN